MSDLIQFSSPPIGIFDSGMGGFIALHKLADLLPNENLLYLGDSARVPYGNRSVETIIEYSKACIRFLLDHDVKEILVACNTSSAVSLPILQALSPVPITGVIQPPIETVLNRNYHRIGVIGTRATIESQAYEKAMRAMGHESDKVVYAKACPLFVPLIEEGWHTHSVAEMIVNEYLGNIAEANIQALILGCTHYSFLEPAIRKLLPDVDIIDSGFEAAKYVAKGHMESTSSIEFEPRKIACYLSDVTPAYTRLAQQFLGFPVELRNAHF